MIKLATVLAFLFSLGMLFAQPENSTDYSLAIQDVHWSPDGSYLLFSGLLGKSDWSDFKPDHWGLYEMNLTNKNIVKIANGAEYGSYSPNRREIAYSKMLDDKWEIVLLNVSTGDTTVLTHNAGNNTAPSFSPDGKKLVFMSDRENTKEIYIMNHNGSEPRRVTFSNGAKAYNPEWSPDGSSITYYLEKGDNKDQVCVLNLEKVQPEVVTNNDLNNVFPGWTKDGSIVYSSRRHDEPSYVFLIGVDGKHSQPVGHIESFYARYSPDGLKMAFVNKSDEGNNIAVAKADGSSPQALLDITAFKQTFGVKPN